MDTDPNPADAPNPASEPRPGVWDRIKGWAAARRDESESNWRFLDGELQRTRLLGKVVALHLRYTFGYLAFGFLVSAPIQLGFRHEAGWFEGLMKSVALGVIFALPCLVLWPFTIIDWGRMRIPEFKNLELALTRWAAIAAAIWLVVAFLVTKIFKAEGWWAWPCDVKVAWTNLGLMFFSWVRVKFHTVMFREFYTLKPEDDLVLRVPPSKLKLFKNEGRKRAEAEVGEALAAKDEGAADPANEEGTDPDRDDVETERQERQSAEPQPESATGDEAASTTEGSDAPAEPDDEAASAADPKDSPAEAEDAPQS